MSDRNDALGFLITEEIVFPDAPAPSYVFDRDCISFPARLDGKPLECLITAEVLMVRYHAEGPTEECLFDAFNHFKDEIHQAAREQIQNRWIEDGRVIITTRFTDMDVRFSKALSVNREAIQRASQAQHILNKIIGPRAGKLSVLWSVDDDKDAISLNIHDETAGLAYSALLPLKDVNPSVFQLRLAELWSSILRFRSHKMVIRSG